MIQLLQKHADNADITRKSLQIIRQKTLLLHYDIEYTLRLSQIINS